MKKSDLSEIELTMLRELTGSIAKKYDQPEDILYRIFLPLIRRSESVSPGFSYPGLIEDSIKLGIPARRILNVIKSLYLSSSAALTT